MTQSDIKDPIRDQYVMEAFHAAVDSLKRNHQGPATLFFLCGVMIRYLHESSPGLYTIEELGKVIAEHAKRTTLTFDRDVS